MLASSNTASTLIVPAVVPFRMKGDTAVVNTLKKRYSGGDLDDFVKKYPRTIAHSRPLHQVDNFRRTIANITEYGRLQLLDR